MAAVQYASLLWRHAVIYSLFLLLMSNEDDGETVDNNHDNEDHDDELYLSPAAVTVSGLT